MINKRSIQYLIVIILTLIFFFAVFSAFAKPGRWSDMNAHIRKHIEVMDGESVTAYPLMYYSAEVIHKAFDLPLEYSYGILLGLCSVLVLFVMYWLFRTTINSPPILAFLGALCVSVILHIWFPGWILRLYYGQGGGNAWLNPSSTAMKPFAVISFIAFAMLLDRLVKKKSLPSEYVTLNSDGFKDNALYIVFVVATILGVLAKPSYVLGFVFAAGIMFFIRIKHFDKKFFFIMLGTSLVLGIMLMVQYSVMFRESGNHPGGLVFSFAIAIENTEHYTPSVLISIMSHLAYPLAVLALFWKDIKPCKNNIYLLSWIFFGVSTLMYLCLSEGLGKITCNMGWTRGIAIFLLQMVTTLEYLKSIKRRGEISAFDKTERRKYDFCLGVVFVCLMLQVYPGVVWLNSFV